MDPETEERIARLDARVRGLESAGPDPWAVQAAPVAPPGPLPALAGPQKIGHPIPMHQPSATKIVLGPIDMTFSGTTCCFIRHDRDGHLEAYKTTPDIDNTWYDWPSGLESTDQGMYA